MRCEVLKCRENDGEGYCCCSDYVSINSDGECSEKSVISVIEEED